MKNSKSVALFILILFIISILTGLIYGYTNNLDIGNYLESLSSHNNLFLYHFVIILLMFFTTIALINPIFSSVITSIEGISVGYIIASFFKIYKIKGLLLSIINIFINKFIFILVIFYLFITGVIYAKILINNLVGKTHEYIISVIKPLIRKYILIGIIVLINDTFIYFLGNIIISFFKSFLI